jgi:hypothetical protein
VTDSHDALIWLLHYTYSTCCPVCHEHGMVSEDFERYKENTRKKAEMKKALKMQFRVLDGVIHIALFFFTSLSFLLLLY